MTSFKIKLPAGDCRYEIGSGIKSSLSRQLKRHLGSGNLFVVYDANFYALHGPRLSHSLKVPPTRLHEFVLPSGEKSKARRILAGIQDFMLQQQIRRSDLVLACGGGVTSDLTGFAASTVLRGVRWAVVPTTLLGMVDAAIGGKTGINHPVGKNLIGAFWQPLFVSADIEYLHTLPQRQMLAGWGEVIKTAGLCGGEFLQLLKEFRANDELLSHKQLCEIIAQTARFKGKIVEADEREAGQRKILNYGHTFGHAIESSLGYRRLLHGEAVLLGIVAALELGEQLGYAGKGLQDYKRFVEQSARAVPKVKLDRDRIINSMSTDKKATTKGLNFVLLKSMGQPVVKDGIKKAQIKQAVDRMIAWYES